MVMYSKIRVTFAYQCCENILMRYRRTQKAIKKHYFRISINKQGYSPSGKSQVSNSLLTVLWELVSTTKWKCMGFWRWCIKDFSIGVIWRVHFPMHTRAMWTVSHRVPTASGICGKWSFNIGIKWDIDAVMFRISEGTVWVGPLQGGLSVLSVDSWGWYEITKLF